MAEQGNSGGGSSHKKYIIEKHGYKPASDPSPTPPTSVPVQSDQSEPVETQDSSRSDDKE